jgi:hypothetical protein
MEALEARRRLDDARNAFALAADKNAALSRAALSPLLRELGDVAPAVDHFGSNYFGDKLRGRSDAMNVALAWPEFEQSFSALLASPEERARRRDVRIRSVFTDFARRLLVCTREHPACGRLVSADPVWLLDEIFDACATTRRHGEDEETVTLSGFNKHVRPINAAAYERPRDKAARRRWHESELGCADKKAGWRHDEFTKHFSTRCVHCGVPFSSCVPKAQEECVFMDDLGALLEQLDRTLGESVFAAQLPHIAPRVRARSVGRATVDGGREREWRGGPAERRGAGSESDDASSGRFSLRSGGGASGSDGRRRAGIVPIVRWCDFRAVLAAQLRAEDAFCDAVHFTPPLACRAFRGARLLTMPALATRDARWRIVPMSTDVHGDVVVALEHGECSFIYRYISRESRSQFDSLPLTSL